MTNEHIKRVQESFRSIADLPPQTLGRVFFSRLTETSPRLIATANLSSYPNRSAELMTVLAYVVSQLHQHDHLVGDLAALARRYARYGVVENDYTPIGEALLSTLEEFLGAGWTIYVREAWTACYALLTQTMIEAAYPSTPASIT